MIEPPMKGKVDFDAFRYWATSQQRKDVMLRDSARIAEAESRKRDRTRQFFRAMASNDPLTKADLRLSLDEPMDGWNAASPRDGASPLSLTRGPSTAPASFHGVGDPQLLRRPMTTTGVPGSRRSTRRRPKSRSKDYRPDIELQFAHRRPLSPAGSSAAWPPMLPSRMSQTSTRVARTSQEKRNEGYKPHSFDELLRFTSPEGLSEGMGNPQLDMGGGFSPFHDSTPGSTRPASVRGQFQLEELRPKSAAALEMFYNSAAARLTRGARSEAVWGGGLAVASERRAATKTPLTTKPRLRDEYATAERQEVSGNWTRPGNARLGTPFVRPESPSGLRVSQSAVELTTSRGQSTEPWHDRLSSTASQLEPIPSFLDSTMGSRAYAGLGTRLNALHVTRKAEATKETATEGARYDRDAPLIARVQA